MEPRKLNLSLAGLLCISLLVNTVLMVSIYWNGGSLTGAAVAVPEIDAVGIEAAGCDECQKAAQILDSINSSGTVRLSSSLLLQGDAAGAKELIEKYGIKRLPAIILKGELDSLPKSDSLKRVDDAIILSSLPPPYFDLETGSVKGLVDVQYITVPKCLKCTNITALGSALKTMGVKIDKEQVLTYDSIEGRKLVSKYNLSLVPTAIFSDDAEAYPIFQQAWPSVGSIDDGAYVLRKPQLPYMEVVSGKVRGLVEFITLKDESCAGCSDANQLKQLLTDNVGFVPVKESEYDVSSSDGKSLIKQYSITAAPTIIVMGDTAAYEGIETSWAMVGTVEEDGALVLRDLAKVGFTFKNLTTNELGGQPAEEPLAVEVVAPDKAPDVEAGTDALPEEPGTEGKTIDREGLNKALEEGLS